MAKRKAAACATLLFGAAALVATGCETGRVNKNHAPFEHANDVTTTSHPERQYAAADEGQPPVPGSPTGAGMDGHQPMNDTGARKSPGAEEGKATPPERQKKDPFIKQQ